MGLEEKAANFTKETGLPFSYLVALNADVQGNPPDADDAAIYAAEIPLSLPVLADPSDQIVNFTPWTGAIRPGKCVLSPSMVMIGCYDGEGDDEGFELIRGDAGISAN